MTHSFVFRLLVDSSFQLLRQDVVVVCEEVAHLSGDSRVICDVGNPVRANYMVSMLLIKSSEMTRTILE